MKFTPVSLRQEISNRISGMRLDSASSAPTCNPRVEQETIESTVGDAWLYQSDSEARDFDEDELSKIALRTKMALDIQSNGKR